MVRSQHLFTGFCFIGALGLIGLLSGCSPRDLSNLPTLPNPNPLQVDIPQAGDKKSYRLGEVFAIRDEVTDVVLTFTTTRKSQGEEFLKPKEGHYWFYITGTITNNKDEEFVISPDFYTVTDNQKKTYTPSIRAHGLEGVKVLQGRIPANADKTGEIGFELPTESTPMLLSFDLSNYTACSDTFLKPTFFCQAIRIQLSDDRG